MSEIEECCFNSGNRGTEKKYVDNWVKFNRIYMPAVHNNSQIQGGFCHKV